MEPLGKAPRYRWSAARISLIYALVGSMWILLSDRLLFRWMSDDPDALWASVVKGLGFIFVTAGMIYHLIRRDMRAVEASQRALADRERQYKALFDEMNEGFSLLEAVPDAEGRPVDFVFREVNPAFEKLTRLPRPQVIGRRLRDVLPNVEDDWFTILAHVVTSGEPVQVQRMARAIQLYIEAVAYRPAAGRVAVLFMDITQRRRLEEQLAQSAKMEAIGRLAGGIAHDFNNLLAVILGYSEALLRQAEEGSPLHGRLTEIDRAAQRGGALTRQLLDFARMGVIAPRRLDLNGVITDLLPMLSSALGEGIQLRVELTSAPAWIEADPAQMEQVVLNLALNARDAMPRGGVLSIRTSELRLPARRPAPPDLAPGRYVLLEVEDTGSGMDEGTQQRVFEPFFSTKNQGTGLGLSIVYGIVEQANGAIDLHTRPGHGTRFDIYIPAGRTQAEGTGAEGHALLA